MSDLPRQPLYIPVFKRRSDQVDFFPNLLLSTLGIVAAVLPPGRSTLATESQPRRQHFSGQTDGIPNLLVSTLALPAVAKPFLNQDLTQWQRKHHSGQSDEQDVGPALSLYITPQGTPTAAEMRVGVSAPIYKRTNWQPTDTPNVVLLRLAPSAPLIVVPQDVSELAKKNRYGQQTEYPQNVTIRLPVGTPAPFLPIDWPQPGRRDSIGGQFNALAVYLPASTPQAPVVVPIDTADQGRRARAQSVDIPQNVTIRLPASVFVPPIIPVDWPQPGRKDSTAGQYSSSTFFQPIPFPIISGLPIDQPRARRTVDADQQRNATITLPASVFVPPFLPVDWPQVPHKAHWQDADPGHNVTLGLPPSVFVPPFLPIDWPQSRRPRQQIPDDWLVNVTLRLPQPVFVPPFIPVDWPIVLTKHPAQQTETHNQVILATLTMPVPWADTANQTRGLGRRITQEPFITPNLLIANGVVPIVVPAAERIVLSYDNLRITISYDAQRLIPQE